MSNKNNLHNNPHSEIPPVQIHHQNQLAESQRQYEEQQRQYDMEQRYYEEQQRELDEHQRRLQQRQTQLEEQRRQQEQVNVASVYPELPSEEELPKYSPYLTMPQAPQQHTPSPEPRYSQIPEHHDSPIPEPRYSQIPEPHYSQIPQPQLQPQPRPPVMYYGSMEPPNVSMPPASQESQPVKSIESLKTKSELVQCPNCQHLVYTALNYDSGMCTGLSVGGLFLAGCHSGGCLIPFLFPWTKDVNHVCPSCKVLLATFTRLERNTRVFGGL